MPLNQNNIRIVVTGMGAVTPIGTGVDTYWNNLTAGVSGIAPITGFDASQLPVRFAGEVRDFDAEAAIPKAYIKNLAPFGQYAFAAAQEALDMSGMEIDPFRTGIVMGTAMDGVAEIANTQAEYDAAERKKVSPRFVPKILGNMAPCQIAIANNIRGPSLTVNTACSSGIDAVYVACMLLQSGAAEAMVAVGGESIMCDITIASLAAAQALSRSNDDPAHACKPFDLHRNGFVMGEGGAVVLLEEYEHAKARGAKIYAEVVGYGSTNDAYHMTAPNPEAVASAKAIELAAKEGGISAGRDVYVNAHGTGTPLNDKTETRALKRAFGEDAYKLHVSSTKSMTGHMLGAAGGIEAIASVLALHEGVVPPTINYKVKDEECDLDITPNEAVPAPLQFALSTSPGFGGHNGRLAFRKL